MASAIAAPAKTATAATMALIRVIGRQAKLIWFHHSWDAPRPFGSLTLHAQRAPALLGPGMVTLRPPVRLMRELARDWTQRDLRILMALSWLAHVRHPDLPDRSWTWRRAFLILLAAFAGVLALAPPVAAHAEVASSIPAANSSQPEPPAQLVLVMTERVETKTLRVQVLNELGEPIAALGSPTLADGGRRVEFALPGLDAGVYTVLYQVLSATDGHVTSGSFAFGVDPSGREAAPAIDPSTSSPAADIGTAGARWLSLGALLALFGTALFWGISARPGATAVESPPPPVPWLLLAMLGGTALGAQALFLSMASRPLRPPGVLPALFDLVGPFGDTTFAFAMRVVQAASFAAAGLAVLGLVAQRIGRRDGLLHWCTLTAAAVALGGFSLGGHAAGTGGPIFAALDWTHLLAVGAWLGSLVGLQALYWQTRRANSGTFGAALRRHSRAALVAAPIVVMTGIANSPILLGASRNLVGSDYGNLLTAKVLLFAVALAIGASNFFLVRRAQFKRVVMAAAAEVMVGALAVLVAAGLLTLSPAGTRAPLTVTLQVPAWELSTELDGLLVQSEVVPPAPGQQVYRVTLFDPAISGPPADVQRVFYGFTPPAESGLSAQRVALDPVPDSPGTWQAGGTYTPIAGEWELAITVRRSGQPDVSSRIAIDILPSPVAETVSPPTNGISLPPGLWRFFTDSASLWFVAPALAGGAVLIWGVSRLVQHFRRTAAALAALRLSAVLLAAFATVVTGAGVLLKLANSVPAASASMTSTVPLDIASISRGRESYVVRCAGCHGPAEQTDELAVTSAEHGLGERSRSSSEGELYYWISNGVVASQMPAFATELRPQERWDVINYLLSVTVPTEVTQ